ISFQNGQSEIDVANILERGRLLSLGKNGIQQAGEIIDRVGLINGYNLSWAAPDQEVESAVGERRQRMGHFCATSIEGMGFQRRPKKVCTWGIVKRISLRKT